MSKQSMISYSFHKTLCKSVCKHYRAGFVILSTQLKGGVGFAMNNNMLACKV